MKFLFILSCVFVSLLAALSLANAVPGKRCRRGKVFNECASPKSCDITCDNISDPPKGCPEVCVARCACPASKPYIQMVNGKEVCVDKCQTNVGSSTDAPTIFNEPRCKVRGMKWNECATPCPPTCSRPDPEVCIALCLEQCECPRGTILNDLSDPPECVESCP